MINPLAPYLSILSFVVEPILKVGTAAVFIGIVMVALGYDPIGLAWGFVENTIRSAIPGV
ncbi:hypothetical protein DVK05_14430 [Halorubrum sp. Atlit-8R]|uniref:hypothetical protein n=1 Tax=unclassified Halorubrum TaxID=2642239 RepID=UPI000EF18129|nr:MULTISPECIES: hypothetical protein [unclassified Halorubrum]RLM63474.1 hypothetical protein DVK08_16175 [Halorubrum sp. Atlit-9R]RLM76950.1 hypothetical protein DVK05_14430 [Halorubrum sp. Atlit-8R]